MSALQNRKNKVILSDYNYRRDIENRLLMAELTTFEVDVLREILNNSLKISLEQIADNMNVEVSRIIPVTEKLSYTKLIKMNGNDTAVVDKEMRKYYESQILKFDEDFEPGMEFLQGLLHKVPIHILPTWYSIPRTSDHIFQSITEKFLATPKIYERYLQELHFDNPILDCISKEVFAAPDFKIRARDLMHHFNLSHEKFEECMLLLEYNFVCCLCYQKNDNCWEEIVTPFYEWHEYLRFKRDTAPKSISDPAGIIRKHPEDFGFVHDMTRILKSLQSKALSVASFDNGHILASKDIARILPHNSTSHYVKNLIEKLQICRLVEIANGQIRGLEQAQEWLKKTVQDRAMTMTRHPIQVEKSLKRIIDLGWVYIDDFIKGFTGILGSREQITLKNKGKRWRYVLPSYSDEEKVIIEKTLCERLFEAGIVAVGTHKGRACICLTPFGRMSLED